MKKTQQPNDENLTPYQGLQAFVDQVMPKMGTLAQTLSPVHVLLSRFYLDSIQILSKFYPDKIWIKSG